jgi:hypothetical protein
MLNGIKRWVDSQGDEKQQDILEARAQLKEILDNQDKHREKYNPENWNKDLEFLENNYPHVAKALGLKKLDLAKYNYAISLRDNLNRQGAKK